MDLQKFGCRCGRDIISYGGATVYALFLGASEEGKGMQSSIAGADGLE